MFTDDPAVYIVRRDVQFLTDQKMKSSCIQVRSTSDHALMRKTADFPGNVRQNVHWKLLNWNTRQVLQHIVFLILSLLCSARSSNKCSKNAKTNS